MKEIAELKKALRTKDEKDTAKEKKAADEKKEEDESLEELRNLYKQKTGNDCPNNKKNDAQRIKSKLD